MESNNGDNGKEYRDELGRFITGNPGRPKGAVSGKTLVLRGLDEMLGKEKNLKAFEKALQEEFEKNPVRFFKQIVIPLIPKSQKLDINPTPPIDPEVFREILLSNVEYREGHAPEEIYENETEG